MSYRHKLYRGSKYKLNYDRNDGLPGVVYILHNEAMRAGLYKIGQSTRSGHARANDLNRTVGTETPKLFRCIFEMHTLDCGRAEKAVHLRLKAHRLTRQEYFDVDLEFAKLVVIEECEKQVPPLPPQPVVSSPPPTSAPTATRRAEAAREKAIADAEQEIKDEVATKQAAWRQDAIQRKSGDGHTAGLKWGAIWFLGTWIFLAMLGAKDTVGWACLGFGVCVYFMSRDGPAREYFGSQSARDEMDRIEAEIRRHFAHSPPNANRASVPVEHPVTTSDHQPIDREKARRNFKQRFVSAAILNQAQQARAKLFGEDELARQVDSPNALNVCAESRRLIDRVKLNGLSVQELLRQALSDTNHQAWIGAEIEKITSLSREQAAKAGLATTVKIIAAYFENLERAAYESNICAMLKNSPPMQLSPAEALAICRLVEGDVCRRWGRPQTKESQTQGELPASSTFGPAPVGNLNDRQNLNNL